MSPDVLGRRSRHYDDREMFEGDAHFTVISPYPERAAAAIGLVADRLMEVDEHGGTGPLEERQREWDEAGEWPYTPNYVDHVTWGEHRAQAGLDTRGLKSARMVRAMAGILVDALVAHGVPAHITGALPDLGPSDFPSVWQEPAAGE